MSETAAGQAEREDGTVSFEFYVPDRAAVRNGEPDGLAEAQNFGYPACGGCRIAVQHVGNRGYPRLGSYTEGLLCSAGMPDVQPRHCTLFDGYQPAGFLVWLVASFLVIGH